MARHAPELVAGMDRNTHVTREYARGYAAWYDRDMVMDVLRSSAIAFR